MNFQEYVETLISNFKGRKTITIDDIKNSNFIHPQYFNYINNEVGKQIDELSCVLRSFKFIDPSSQDTKNLFDSFLYELRQRIEFDVNILRPLLLSALKLHYNYLTKPISTLLFFIFGNSTKKTKNDIIFLITYFTDYKEFLNKIHKEIEKLFENEITVYEFNHLVREVGFDFFNTATTEELLVFFKPIFDFFAQANKNLLPPVDSLISLFDDFRLLHFSNFLEDFCKTNNIQYIDLELLKHILLESSILNLKLLEIKEMKQSSCFGVNNISFTSIEPFVFTLPFEIPKIPDEFLYKFGVEDEVLVAKKEEVDEIKNLLSAFDSKDRGQIIESSVGLVENVQNINDYFGQEETEKDKEISMNLESETPSGIENMEYQDIELQGVELQEEESTEIQAEAFTFEVEDIEMSTTQAVEDGMDTISIDESRFEPVENALEVSDNFQSTPDDAITSELDNVPLSSLSFNLLIGEQKRKQLIDELFYTMEEEYNNLVDKIDSADTLEKAMEFTNSYFQDFGIFPEMPIAKEFIELVKLKFSQSNKIE